MKKTIDARFIKIAGRNAVFQIGDSIHVLPIPEDTQVIMTGTIANRRTNYEVRQ